MTEELTKGFRGLDKPNVPLSEAVEYFTVARYSRVGVYFAASKFIDLIKCRRLVASGDDTDGNRQEIPVNDFTRLMIPPFGERYTGFARDVFVWAGSRLSKPMLGVPLEGDAIERGGRLMWRNICVSRDDLLKVASIGPKERAVTEPPNLRVASGGKPLVSGANFTRDYKAYIEKAKREGRRTTEQQDREAFENVSRDIVRDLRRATVPEWCERGRPKKNRGD